MIDMVNNIQKGVNEKKLTREEIEQMRQEVSTPDMRPQPFDVSLYGWLARIDLWGKVKFTHIDPENRKKEEVTRDKFIKKMMDPNLLKMFGVWKIDELALNKIRIYRRYIGMDAKEYTEEFIVSIDLRDELKPALRAGGIVGWIRDAFGAITGI